MMKKSHAFVLGAAAGWAAYWLVAKQKAGR